MADQKRGERIRQLVRDLGATLVPLMYPPRPDHPVIAPYAVMNACGHVDLSDERSYLDTPDDLMDLIRMNLERRDRLVARTPSRASERAPGCPECMVAIAIARGIEPPHWRLN